MVLPGLFHRGSTPQPIDSDLSAIAAVSTTSFGRSLLAAADAAALRTLGAVSSANQKSVFAVGTAYTLTNTPAALDFGTTDPTLTLDLAGTYLLLARAKVNYTAATFAAVRTFTGKLRRTNNTAADLTGGTVTASTQIITTLTFTAFDLSWWTIYTTAATDDAITIFGDISTVPTAGSLDVTEASIIAVRLQQ